MLSSPPCQLLPALLLALTSMLVPSQALADELVTYRPVLEGQAIAPSSLVDLSNEPSSLTIREIASESPITAFSVGDYSHLPPADSPMSGQKAIDPLNLDFDITAGAVDHGEPDIAFNSTNNEYLVVFVRSSGGATGNDIYGQRLSATGAAIGSPFAIIADPGNESRPRVIYNPVSNEFIVVANFTSTSTQRVVSRVVPAAGLPTALVFDPFPSVGDANSPDVAFNASSAEYVLVSGQIGQDSILMRRMAVGSGTPQGIELQFLDGDGVADAAPTVVAYPTTGEYVIFSERISGSLRGIFGYRLPSNLSGATVVTGFTVGTNSFAPRIVADTGRGEIFLTWQLAASPTDTVFNTAVVPVNFTSGGLGTISLFTTAPTDDRRPRVAYQPVEDDFLVTWSQAGAISQTVVALAGGTTTGDVQSNTSSAPTTTADPSIAVNGVESLLVWTENSTPAQIRGRLLGTPAPSLAVNPTSLDFGTTTTSLPLTLTNTGTGNLGWGTEAFSWVIRTPGTDSFFTTQNIMIGVDRSGLAPGTYNVTLTFLVPAATDVDVPITMTVPNTPPVAPANPSPANGATNQPVAFRLDWTSSDADFGQIVRHDLYLSTHQALVDSLDASVRLGSDFTNSHADVSGLGHITTYFWRIVAKDGVTSTPGPTWSFQTARVGMTTLTPMPDSTNDSTPTFQWSAVADAASYELRVATDPDFGNIALIVNNITSTSHTPAAPLGDNEYFWTVITVAPNGTDSLSPSADAFVIDTVAPAVPTLSAVSSPTSNARPPLSWSASAGATSYRLQAATDAAFSNMVLDQAPSGTSVTPGSDLPEGTIYWRVAAIDATGNQSAFASGSFEIDLTAPAAPVLIAAPDPTGDPRQAMTWNPSTGAATYRIQVSTDAAFASTLFDQAGLVTTAFTPSSDLPEGTIYWRVLATDAAANSSAFSAAGSFDVDLTAPAVPTLNPLIPDPINNPRPELTWPAVPGAANYALEVSETAFVSSAGPPESAQTTLLFTGVISGTSWTSKADLPEGPIYWRLASRDDLGNQSAFSAADDFTLDLTPPAVPTLTPVSPDPTADATPQLTWSTENEAVAYRVQVSTVSDFATTLLDVSTLTTSFTPSSDLPEGTIYWRVASRDVAENDSEFAVAESFVIDQTAPGVPALIAVTPDPTNERRPTLTWNAVSGAAEYRFILSSLGTLGGLIETTVTGTSFTPALDLPEGGIVWQVASRDALGNESALSTPDTFTIDVTPPGVPALVTVTPDPTNNPRPALAWGAVSGATDYRVQVSTDVSFASTLFDLEVAGTSWTPPSDLPEGAIFWRASSRDALTNESAFSNADTFTIDITAPGVPVLAAVSPDPTSDPRPFLSWGTVSGAADYRVQVSTDAAFSSTLFDLIVAGTSWTPTSDLPEGTIYWRASSRDALENESGFAAADDFQVDLSAPGVPVLTPVAPDPTNNPRPTFEWSAVGEAALYRLQIATDASFATPITDVTQAGTSFTPAADLPEGSIFWRVSSLDALSNESPFSAADDFVIDLTAPAAIARLRPSWSSVTSWFLRWQPSAENDFAHYAIYRESAPFTETSSLTPIDTSITDPTQGRFTDPAPLPAQDGHYAVVAVDAAGNALSAVVSTPAPGPAPFFVDGFESGDLTAWSSSVP